jgi:predicted metal-dependent hydrolase
LLSQPDISCANDTILNRWYRQLLRDEIPKLIAKWEQIIQANVADWGIKKMKTRWGTCNKGAGRIWINLELAKKPPSCLEYIFVHEMIHLLERHHNDRFREYMDRFMPSWRRYQEELNRAPLSHESWNY